MERERPDLVLLDVKMPGLDGLEVLRKLRELDELLPVVMISGHGTVSTAVEATKLGAFDFLEKPLSSERVRLSIRNALNQRRLTAENRRWRRAAEVRHEMVGASAALSKVTGEISRAAPVRSAVLIQGESGGGEGAGGPRHPPQQPARARAVRAGQLRRDPRRPDRVGALRAREGLVHRRHREAGRQVRAGGPGGRSSSTRSAT